MDLRQLEYFIAVVDHGSFTGAAKATRVSQPSLSQAIRSLESQLGTSLFHRVGRGVRLAPAGDALVEPARQTLRDAAVARAAVTGVADLSSGRLDLTCLPSLAVDPAVPLIGRFRRAHPGVTVRLAEPGSPEAVLADVRCGNSELGLTELPDVTDLVAHPLAGQAYVAVLPPESAPSSAGAAGSTAMTLAELAGLPLITTPPGTSTRRIVDEAFAASGLRPTVAVETDHRETIPALVAAGAGVSLLPPGPAGAARALGAVTRPLTPTVQRAVGVVHRSGPLSPAARAFMVCVTDARHDR